MSFSFFQIEEQKTRKIYFLFLILAISYFLGILLIYWALIKFSLISLDHGYVFTVPPDFQGIIAEYDNDVKRSHELVSELVSKMKTYVKDKEELLEIVNRDQIKSAGAVSVFEKMQAEKVLTKDLNSLFILAEDYPKLKNNQEFLEIQHELSAKRVKIEELTDAIEEFWKSAGSMNYNLAIDVIRGRGKVFFINLINVPGRDIFFIILIALLLAILHWRNSTRDMVNRILNIIKAKPLDKNDQYHQILSNIVGEASAAAGGKFMIEPFIINSHYLNAFAIADFEKRCVIGISEGLIVKLNRCQLEGVVAHEVSHIVMGDSLVTTVSSSVVAIYTVLFKKIVENKKIIRKIWNLPLIIIISVLHLFTKLLNAFISRNSEYRADATAVRLTRDPLSLAEALYLIKKGWHGANLSLEQEFSPIFIVNPLDEKLDEKEGLIANLFSTHPPINKRIDILLNIAHSNLQELESLTRERTPLTEAIPLSSPLVQKFWYVSNEGKWQGPFNLVQLTKLAWFAPTNWVKEDGDGKVKPAYEYKEFKDIFSGNISVLPDNFSCPVCHQGLENVYYEGVPIGRCRFCGGHLVKHEQLARLISRRDMDFSEDVKKLANAVLSSTLKTSNKKTISLLTCSACDKKMFREGYSGIFPYWVEVDTCPKCGFIWFDKNELEVVQYLMEKYIN